MKSIQKNYNNKRMLEKRIKLSLRNNFFYESEISLNVFLIFYLFAEGNLVRFHLMSTWFLKMYKKKYRYCQHIPCQFYMSPKWKRKWSKLK